MVLKKYLSLLFIFLLAVVTAGCGGNTASPASDGNSTSSTESESSKGSSKEEIVIKIGHILPESNVIHQTALAMQEELDKKTEGRITLDIYPHAVLGGEPDIYQQLKAGSINAAFITAAELSNHSEAFTAWLMPELIKDHNDAYEIAKTEEAKALFTTLENVHGLGNVFGGMYYTISPEAPITKLDDIKGKKVRVIPTPAYIDWWKELGASPTPIPTSDIYTSFQTGVIDMLSIDLEITLAQGLHDIGNHFTPAPQTIPMGFLFNTETWESLSEEDKQIINDAFATAAEFNLNINLEREESNLKELQDQGENFHEFEDQAEIEKLADAFHQKYSEKSELIKNFISAAKELNKE